MNVTDEELARLIKTGAIRIVLSDDRMVPASKTRRWSRKIQSADEKKKQEAERLRKYREKNRERLRSKSREWYRKNSEKVLKEQAKYRKSNPEKRAGFAAVRRSRRYGKVDYHDSINAAKRIRELKSGVFSACAYCGETFPTKSMTIDHIQPLSRGGLHVAENLTLACVRCNCSKGDKILGEQQGNTTQLQGEKWYTRTGSNRENRDSSRSVKGEKSL